MSVRGDCRNYAGRDDASRPSQDLLDQISKRLTLNLLIQGAAIHTCLTAHYLVKDELDELNPRFIPQYDKLAVSVALASWVGDLVIVCGRPSRFWNRVKHPGHPFCNCPLLVKQGAELATAAKSFAMARAKEKGVSRVPGIYSLQLVGMLLSTLELERAHKPRLAELAKRATSMIWGIDEERLDARLTFEVEFGNIRPPATLVGKMIRASAAGFGGVELRDSKLIVVARAWLWPLLSHELVKGTAELVGLHGLNTLDRQTYLDFTESADRIEHETWLMQAGAELWRRFLAALPEGRTLAETLMTVAQLCPRDVQTVMMAVVEDPNRARRLLDGL